MAWCSEKAATAKTVTAIPKTMMTPCNFKFYLRLSVDVDLYSIQLHISRRRLRTRSP